MPDAATGLIAGVGLLGVGTSLWGSQQATQAAQQGAAQAAAASAGASGYSQAMQAPWTEAGQNALWKLMGGPTEEAQAYMPKMSKYTEKRPIKHGPGYWYEFNQRDYQKAMDKWEARAKERGQWTQGLIEQGPGEFEESPSYQFALEEGQKGIQRAASATGRLGSGDYLKDATKYAEGMASTEYQNFLNRWYQSLTPWQSMAGIGQTAATNVGNTATQAAGQQGQYALYSGGAGAANYINQANTATNALSGGLNTYLMYNALRNLPQQQYQPYSSYRPYTPSEGYY